MYHDDADVNDARLWATTMMHVMMLGTMVVDGGRVGDTNSTCDDSWHQRAKCFLQTHTGLVHAKDTAEQDGHMSHNRTIIASHATLALALVPAWNGVLDSVNDIRFPGPVRQFMLTHTTQQRKRAATYEQRHTDKLLQVAHAHNYGHI